MRHFFIRCQTVLAIKCKEMLNVSISGHKEADK